MKKIFLIIFCLFVLTACFDKNNKETNQDIKYFQANEEIKLKNIFGKEIVLLRKNNGFVLKSDTQNPIIMFDIFGTFCPPCQEEAAGLMAYQIKNKDKFLIIALTHFENVSDQYVIDEFASKYNAYYFISNDQNKNNRIIEQIIKDIGYNKEIALPFKVILKNGEYQKLTDIDSKVFGVKYYLGGIGANGIDKDLSKIYDK